MASSMSRVGYRLSYSWTKTRLQAAGLVKERALAFDLLESG